MVRGQPPGQRGGLYKHTSIGREDLKNIFDGFQMKFHHDGCSHISCSFLI